MSNLLSGAPGLAPGPLGSVSRASSAIPPENQSLPPQRKLGTRRGAAHLSHTGIKDSGTWAFSPGLRPWAGSCQHLLAGGLSQSHSLNHTTPHSGPAGPAALTTRPLRPALRPGPCRAPRAWLRRACAYLAAPPPGSGPARTLAHRGRLGSSAPDRRLPPGRSQGRGRCAHTGHARGARGGGKAAGSEPSRPGRRRRGQAAPALGMPGTRAAVGSRPAPSHRGRRGRGRSGCGRGLSRGLTGQCPSRTRPLGSRVGAQ